MSLHSSLTKSQIDLIFKVVDELIKHNYSVVKDEYGCTSILIRSVFCPETVSADFPGAFLVTSSNYKTVRIHDCTSKYYDIVVGIGNVSVIDVAKKLSYRFGKKLVVIPSILSNDSFCTDRVTGNCSRSWRAIYPHEVIIDLQRISEIPININCLGIGEFIGLYVSYMDFCVSQNEITDNRIIDFILSSFKQLVEYRWEKVTDKLKFLSICLIFKCLIMRIHGNYQIGCGIDHSLAKAIEKMHDIPHGIAVLWGCAISLALFPRWCNSEISPHAVLRASSTMEPPTPFTADQLIANLGSTIDLAREIRPLGGSCINGLNSNQITAAKRMLWDI
jgi:glycerol dehydrogenase-like iron-containing ADH family enzyme